jgi:hypothetical protein
MSTASPRRWRRAGLALIAAAAAVLGAGLLGTGSAGASAPSHLRIDIVGSGDGFTATPSVPLLVTDGFTPGASASGTMGVRSDSASATDLYLRLIGVTDDDNGCTAAEATVDRSCGPGQGDLGRELVFRITVATSEHGRYLPQWTGTGTQLAQGVPVAQAVAAKHAQWVRLSVQLPVAAGNDTQTDTFGFAVRVTAQDSSGVEGISIGRGGAVAPAAGGHSPLGLAFTGAQLGVLTAAGLLLLTAGIVLGFGARSRRRSAQR